AEPYAWQNTVDLPHAVELLDAGLDWLAGQRLDALVLLGDLTEAADKESFAVVQERALALGAPVLAVPGNCDVDPVERSLSAFQEIRGERVAISPALLSLLPGCMMELVHLGGEPRSKLLRGVRPSQSSLAPDVQLVLTHYPVLELESDLTAKGFRHSGDLTNRGEIEEELRTRNTPIVIVHGHLHVHDARISGSLLHLSCGALVEPPHLVHIVEVDMEDGRIDVRRHAHSVRNDAVERLPVFAPLDQAWVWDGICWTEFGSATLSRS
ncbi:MAG TPA: metallophosphoesterase family protein, partial [Thermomicrobiales bacterium]|nr:metallophosphoesterase family protein [Thermomicrobiales bacterium]